MLFTDASDKLKAKLVRHHCRSPLVPFPSHRARLPCLFLVGEDCMAGSKHGLMHVRANKAISQNFRANLRVGSLFSPCLTSTFPPAPSTSMICSTHSLLPVRVIGGDHCDEFVCQTPAPIARSRHFQNWICPHLRTNEERSEDRIRGGAIIKKAAMK